MAKNQVRMFAVPIGAEDPIQLLGQRFRLASASPEQKTVTYFDTFDWRLYSKGCLLCWGDGVAALAKPAVGSVLHETAAPSPPVFSWSLKPGPLKDTIAPLMDVRSLRPLITVTEESQFHKVLDDNDKTVCRLIRRIFRDHTQADAALEMIVVEPVRGYGSHAKEVCECLAPALGETDLKATLEAMLARAGFSPLDYSSKMTLNLDPAMAANQATLLILRKLLNVIQLNVAGTKEDIDTEYLHDFRVAVRKTRAVLSQIKGVLPPDWVAKAKADFTTLGKATNLMRDTHVYLLYEEAYKGMVPPETAAHLDAFFTSLKRRRRGERKKLRDFLDSDHFQRIVAEWGAAFEHAVLPTDDAPDGARPIVELAKRFLRKKHRRVLKDGAAIRPNTPDTALHDLRIECKKLRYLLEFFTSLFPKEVISVPIKDLKALQTKLGDFNDLHVQQETLKSFVEHQPKSLDKRDVIFAVGVLVGVLNHKQTVLRKACLAAVADFAAKKESFHQLFS